MGVRVPPSAPFNGSVNGSARLARRSPAGAHRRRELVQDRHRHLPAQAGVGDALAVDQARRVGEILTALDEEALHQHADDAALAPADLRRDVPRHLRLAAIVLLAVAVARVDHQPRRRSGGAEGGERLSDAGRLVVRAALPAPQDHVAVGVAAGRDDAGEALFGDAQEAVRMGGRAHRVDRDLHPAVGAVLESDRHRQARRQLSMNLTFSRARPDGAPAHEIGDELGGDRVEEFAARGQPDVDEVEQEPAAAAQPDVDGEASVQVRIVDQPLPAHRGARLLEVHPHDDAQIRRELVGRVPEAQGVVVGGGRIVDGARADDHEQPVAPAAQDVGHFLARARDHERSLLGERQLLDEDRGGQQRLDALDAEVAGFHPPIVIRRRRPRGALDPGAGIPENPGHDPAPVGAGRAGLRVAQHRRPRHLAPGVPGARRRPGLLLL